MFEVCFCTGLDYLFCISCCHYGIDCTCPPDILRRFYQRLRKSCPISSLINIRDNLCQLSSNSRSNVLENIILVWWIHFQNEIEFQRWYRWIAWYTQGRIIGAYWALIISFPACLHVFDSPCKSVCLYICVICRMVCSYVWLYVCLFFCLFVLLFISVYSFGSLVFLFFPDASCASRCH